MPTQLLFDGMLKRRCPQWEGIWRPAFAGSSTDPTDARNISSGCDADGQAQRTIAVVGEEPVFTRTQLQPRGHEDGFVAGAADLEERFLLVLEQDLLVVDLSRQEHESIGREQLVARQALVITAARLRSLRAARCACLGASRFGSVGAGVRAVGQALHRSQIISRLDGVFRRRRRIHPVGADRTEDVELEGVFERLGLMWRP